MIIAIVRVRMYKHIKALSCHISATSVQSTKPPPQQAFKLSSTDSIISSAKSSDDSVIVVDETVRTQHPPPATKTCTAQTGLTSSETRYHHELHRQLGLFCPSPCLFIQSFPTSGETLGPTSPHTHHLCKPRDPLYDA
jgi:hypothetical protein